MESYPSFPKIPRLRRRAVITEKIDGTNGLVAVAALGAGDDDGSVAVTWSAATGSSIVTRGGILWEVRAGSRNRWLTPDNDNYGFAAWVRDHAVSLSELGSGHHYGEWWGQGIQRGYGLSERRFSLFNASRWRELDADLADDRIPAPSACGVVPVICQGIYADALVDEALEYLRIGGSDAAPGWMRPEGVVVYHTQAKTSFKALLEHDDLPKGATAQAVA